MVRLFKWVVVILFASGCAAAPMSSASTPSTTASLPIQTVDEAVDSWQALVSRRAATLAVFMTAWCEVCEREQPELERWVEETARVTGPKRVQWCDGSEEENRRLIEEMLDEGTLRELNPERWPQCYLHRSNSNDVARTEHLTFICSEDQDRAGPTNNWMAPAEARQKVGALFD